MAVTLWRVAVFVCVVLGIVEIAANLIAWPLQPAMPFLASNKTNGTFVVTSVKPEGARLGVRAGDVLHIAPGFENRIRFARTELGDTIRFLTADGRIVDAPTHPAANQLPAPIRISWFVIVSLYLGMAALLAFRKFDDIASRSLASFLACFGFGTAGYSSFENPAIRLSATIVEQVVLALGLALLLLFATTFPQQDARGFRWFARRAVPWLSIAMAVLLAASFVLFTAGVSRLGFAFSTAYMFSVVVTIALTIPSFIVSIVRSKGSDRPRMMWLAATFSVALLGLIVQLAYVLITKSFDGAGLYAGFAIGVVPLGLAYVILRHRVLDITFVINRAIVYATVSAFIVGAFMALEWLIGHFVEGRFENMALQFASSLALGLSARYIHQRVDGFVDDVFFRERHRAEEAVRTFAAESLMITDRDELLRKSIEVAQSNMRLTGVSIYVADGHDYRLVEASTLALPTVVSENDYLVLSLRTWLAPRDLGEARSALRGEVAFPMRVRGALSGFLVCGPKLSAEAIAPDERAALALLAHDVGIALDSLRVGEIERELAALRPILHRGAPQPAG